VQLYGLWGRDWAVMEEGEKEKEELAAMLLA